MSFSDEDIIAYLLGEAEASLSARIEDCLHSDSLLAERVNYLRLMLSHLSGAGHCFEPPDGLIEATMRRMSEADSETGQIEPSSSHGQPANSEIAAPQPFPVHSAPKHSAPKSRGGGILGLAREWGQYHQLQNAFDSIALCFGVVCLSCLILPAILRARFESRRAQCAENLRTNGQALFCFALRNPDHRLPAVESSGPEAFAGVYAVRLYDAGLLRAPNQLHCVSLVGVDRPMVHHLAFFPTLDELRRATEQKLAYWQQVLGGDYAFNLGILEKHKVVAPKNTGSSYFAILADTPTRYGNDETWVAHDGQGTNILYDDGHVAFLTRSTLSDPVFVGDHPYWNRIGLREAGLDDRDASLAPSPFPPLER